MCPYKNKGILADACQCVSPNIIVALLTTAILLGYQVYHRLPHALLESFFNVISMGTTTGLTLDHFTNWPTFLPILIMVVGLIGGCGASTSGGLKIIRALLLQKQTSREIARLIHPNAVLPIKFAGQVLSDTLFESIWAFFSAFFMVFILLLLMLMASGLDVNTSFNALFSTLTNLGAGIGAIANGFNHLNLASKWILIFAMLTGRLEIFSVLVLFSRRFWQH